MPPKKNSRSAVQAKTAKRAGTRAPASKPQAGRAATKYVYAFDETRAAELAAGSRDGVLGLLGGKGANLAEMTKLGLPVPPGFTVTTQACSIAAPSLPPPSH